MVYPLHDELDIVTWQEEFTLPAPAVVWSGAEGKTVQVSSDRQTAVKQMTVAPTHGWIGNGWSIAEGDPSGRHVMKIFVEGRLVKEFVFFVE